MELNRGFNEVKKLLYGIFNSFHSLNPIDFLFDVSKTECSILKYIQDFQQKETYGGTSEIVKYKVENEEIFGLILSYGTRGMSYFYHSIVVKYIKENFKDKLNISPNFKGANYIRISHHPYLGDIIESTSTIHEGIISSIINYYYDGGIALHFVKSFGFYMCYNDTDVCTNILNKFPLYENFRQFGNDIDRQGRSHNRIKYNCYLNDVDRKYNDYYYLYEKGYKNLSSFLQEESFNIVELKEWTFQIIWSLYVSKKVFNFIHFDPHIGNIVLFDVDKYQYLGHKIKDNGIKYKVGNTTTFIKNERYFPKFIDYGFSSLTSTYDGKNYTFISDDMHALKHGDKIKHDPNMRGFEANIIFCMILMILFEKYNYMFKDYLKFITKINPKIKSIFYEIGEKQLKGLNLSSALGIIIRSRNISTEGCDVFALRDGLIEVSKEFNNVNINLNGDRNNNLITLHDKFDPSFNSVFKISNSRHILKNSYNTVDTVFFPYRLYGIEDFKIILSNQNVPSINLDNFQYKKFDIQPINMNYDKSFINLSYNEMDNIPIKNIVLHVFRMENDNFSVQYMKKLHETNKFFSINGGFFIVSTNTNNSLTPEAKKYDGYPIGTFISYDINNSTSESIKKLKTYLPFPDVYNDYLAFIRIQEGKIDIIKYNDLVGYFRERGDITYHKTNYLKYKTNVDQEELDDIISYNIPIPPEVEVLHGDSGFTTGPILIWDKNLVFTEQSLDIESPYSFWEIRNNKPKNNKIFSSEAGESNFPYGMRHSRNIIPLSAICKKGDEIYFVLSEGRGFNASGINRVLFAKILHSMEFDFAVGLDSGFSVNAFFNNNYVIQNPNDRTLGSVITFG